MQSLLFEHALWSTKDLELLYIYIYASYFLLIFLFCFFLLKE